MKAILCGIMGILFCCLIAWAQPASVAASSAAPLAAQLAPALRPAAAPTVPVAAVNANLRAGPGLNYRIVGSVTRGTRLYISSCSFGWCRLTSGCYIASWLVRWAPVQTAVQQPPPPKSPSRVTPELPLGVAPTLPDRTTPELPPSSQPSAGMHTPRPSPSPSATPLIVRQGRAAENANLRAGPGMGYRVVAWALKDDPLEVVETNRYGTWSRLANGLWIATRLVQFEPAPTATATP